MTSIARVLCVLGIALLLVTPAFAKRGAPVEVAAVKVGEVEYRVPHTQMGCVEAWDTKRNTLLWRRQIYVVKYYDAELEKDVQDTFITAIKVQQGQLIVQNERNSEYALELDSLLVKVVKGKLVEKSR